MNKNIKLFSLALAILFFVSCDNNDDATGYSSVTVNNSVGTVTAITPSLVFGTAMTVNEGDEGEYTYQITIDQPQPVDLHLKPKKVGGDAVLDSDYEVSEVIIPAYSTTGTGTIKILNDEIVENTKTLTLQIGSDLDANVNTTSKTVIFNIENFVSDVLNLTFNFDKEFFAGENAYSLCDIQSDLSGDPYDIDFLVYDDSFNDLGVLDAQTGACPEKIAMDLADYVDGTYHITAYLYTNAELDLAEIGFPLIGVPEFEIPITVDYLRAGAINKGTYTQEAANFFTSNTAVGSENQVVDIVISTVGANRIFTIQDTAGNVSASGRMAAKSKHISKRVK